MVNAVLFWSSAACGLAHLAAASGAAPHTYKALTLLGVVTSLFNHGTTSRSAQVADRATMWIGGVTDLFVLWWIGADPATWALFTLVPATYAAAKWSGSTATHLLSHAAITSVHFSLLTSRSWQKLNFIGG
jgi:hypothetical protein